LRWDEVSPFVDITLLCRVVILANGNGDPDRRELTRYFLTPS
jgi:hypothetical protein